LVDPEGTQDVLDCHLDQEQESPKCAKTIHDWTDNLNKKFEKLEELTRQTASRDRAIVQKCQPLFDRLSHQSRSEIERTRNQAALTECIVEGHCPKQYASWRRCISKSPSSSDPGNVMEVDLDSFSGECVASALDVRECMADNRHEARQLRVLGIKPFAT